MYVHVHGYVCVGTWVQIFRVAWVLLFLRILLLTLLHTSGNTAFFHFSPLPGQHVSVKDYGKKAMKIDSIIP